MMGKYSLTDRPRVFLNKGKARPFWYRHPWVFSGAVHHVKGEPQNGDVVEVFDHEGNFIAKGFYNTDSRISVRLLSWDLHQKIDEGFFAKKIRDAADLREKVFELPARTDAYRVIHGEGDGLPGLIVDRYADILSIQFLSAGMDQRRETLLGILRETLAPRTIVERYHTRHRRMEGLEEIDYRVHGEEPPDEVEIAENGIRFAVNLRKGQKTGFYLDQRENRQRLSEYPRRRRALDAFCYTGGFGIYLLARNRASEVTFLDSSSFALGMVEENLRRNKIESNFTVQKADIFKRLPEMQSAGEKFDLIVLDPPKVVPEKADLKQGLHSLRSLNATALRMLEPWGVFATCDCSGDVTPEDFWKVLNESCKEADRDFHIADFWRAGADHPALPSCQENSYLKVAVGTVTAR
jgi:23S rRNA (cytosine1962-C5)-methyltransferase